MGWIGWDDLDFRLSCNFDVSAQILGIMVDGGQVSENANISSALNPAWRTAKTHIIIFNSLEQHVPHTRGTRQRATF
ncbi:hypothetical protein BT96DRAFT_929508 [Gymnopus androsaceus JB14]|uniref:Uncharacterized protein n=1 Tax=Gymnopus androsaceus JB14 TaxID=1447944 RepID=A0A6A4GEZ7_9AGAR|nr:hypothetical protein BT96DRAFT_929508 [Gymnopus androsaceus JB14]